MTTSVKARSYLVKAVATLLLCGLASSPLMSADYLSELEAEAQNMEDMNNRKGGETSNFTASSATDNTLHKDLNRPGFEENLKQASLGSYHVFTKLNSTYQEEVYQAYQEGASLDKLRNLIKDLFNQLK